MLVSVGCHVLAQNCHEVGRMFARRRRYIPLVALTIDSREVGDSPVDRAGGDLVTVAIPALEEAGFIADCLDSVLAQTHRLLQVIVVAGPSRDATAEIVRRYTEADRRIRMLHNPDRNISRSLNLALAAARGRWFVRIDAHSTVPSDYICRIVAHLETGRWAGVGGRKDGVARTAGGRAVAAAMASRFGVGDSVYHYGTDAAPVDHVPFGAYPTDLVRSLGGWDENLSANEDFEFDCRLRECGHTLIFDPAIRIRWHCRESPRELFCQYRRYGRSKPAVALLHPGSFRLRHVVPPGLVASWMLATLLIPYSAALAAAVAAPYLLALPVAVTAVPSGGANAGLRLRLAASFAAMHLGWGLGFLEAAPTAVGAAIFGRVRTLSRETRHNED